MGDALLRDIRYAWRQLRRSPGFTIVAVLSLGLGVGVNTAMYSLVDGLLFRPLPVERPDRLVDVFTTGGDGDRYATSSYPDFLDLKARSEVFSDMLAFSPAFAALNLGDRSRLLLGHLVTSNHFAMLGVRPRLGRLLEPSDDRPDAARVVAISHRMWRREFGGDPAVLGRPVYLRGQPYTIVGVAPAAFTGVVPFLVPELWIPIAHAEEVEPAGIIDTIPSPTGTTRLDRRGNRWLFVKGRLKPGVSADQAHARLAVLGRQLAAAHPQTNDAREISAVPTSEVRAFVPQAGGVLTAGGAALMAVASLVLLIACANVAGMLLARAASRHREIGVRLAIGASRGRLVQQLIVEGLVLGTLGSVVAAGCAAFLLQVLGSLELPVPGDVRLEFGLDLRVLAFMLATAIATGLLAGLLPAIKASSPSLVGDLRGGPTGAAAAGRRWAPRDLLVAMQVALTAVLLVVAGLLARSLFASQRADVGFAARGLAIVSFDTGMLRYPDEEGRRFHARALERIRALPGVQAAASASPRVPFNLNFSQQELYVDSRTYARGDRGESIMYATISPGYFATLGIPLVEGRDLTEADTRSSQPVVVINRNMARRYWPDSSAVGRTITVAATKVAYRVVGVAADHTVSAVNERPTPFVHFASAQRPSSFNLIVARTSGSAEALLAAMRRELFAMEPRLVLMSEQTMDEAIAMTLLPARVGAALAAGFGALGTLLAALGLYGVIAYSVSRRTREIGIRMALGSGRARVVRLVLSQGLVLTAAGLAVGVALAAGVARLLGPVLFGIGAADPVAWTGALGVLLAAALAANVVPARRAARVDPAVAIRTE